MTGFVVGDDQFLFLRDDAALALGTGDHALDGFLELGHADGTLVAPCRQNRRFVHQVLNVGADETTQLVSKCHPEQSRGIP